MRAHEAIRNPRYRGLYELAHLSGHVAACGEQYQWRASASEGGNPGESDALAFSGSVLADLDGDGLVALLEYSLGTSEAAATATPLTLRHDGSGRWLLSVPRRLNADDAVLTIETAATPGSSWVPAETRLEASILHGEIATESWEITPPVGASSFFIRVRATLR